MRSYEAARSYFNFLGVLSRGVIAIGAIVALFSIVAAGQISQGFGGGGMAGLAGILPAAVIMFTGFMGLVIVQIGRAGVDTAEYTQQMLKIARDQLEVSRQALRGPNAPANSFADATNEVDGTLSGYGVFADSTIAEALESETQESIEDITSHVNDPEVEQGKKDGVLYYDGQKIVVENHAYYLKGRVFTTLAKARAKIPAVKS